MLKLSTSAKATVPFSVWVRPDLTRGTEEDGVSTELVMNIRVVRTSEGEEYRAAKDAKPFEMAPKFVASFENLELDDVVVNEVTPAVAKSLPMWVLNAAAKEFQRLNGFSEAEAGN